MTQCSPVGKGHCWRSQLAADAHRSESTVLWHAAFTDRLIPAPRIRRRNRLPYFLEALRNFGLASEIPRINLHTAGSGQDKAATLFDNTAFGRHPPRYTPAAEQGIASAAAQHGQITAGLFAQSLLFDQRGDRVLDSQLRSGASGPCCSLGGSDRRGRSARQLGCRLCDQARAMGRRARRRHAGRERRGRLGFRCRQAVGCGWS